MTTDAKEEAERIHLAGAAVTPEEVESTLPRRVLLVPWDWVRSANGDFLVDAEAAEAVLHAFARQGTDLVIDYEHQSLGGRHASPDGLAPAAGWVTALDARPGEGIWGQVRWTPSAARRVRRREYRFLSPVVIVRRQDRRVMALDSVALTNRPAIAGMWPVVNQRDGFVDAQGAGLSTQTPKEETMQEEVRQLRQLLSLDEQVTETQVVHQACGRLAALLEQDRQREAEQCVAGAMQAGKVCEAQKAWATRYALRDPSGFQEWLADAPVLVPLSRPGGQNGQASDPRHGRRTTAIAAARREWKDNPLLQQLTGERAYVDEALHEAGLDGLAAEEPLEG